MTIEHVALVTGAGRRIGRAIAEDLGRHGFFVAVHANGSAEEAGDVAAAIRAAGGAAEAFLADLAEPGAPADLVARIVARRGAPTLIVNNASVFEPDSADAFDEALFDRHMAVHVKAPVQLVAAMEAALPEGAEGVAVNMIDQRVWRLTPGFFSYTLSKSALLTATKTMAMTHAPKIRVNAIGPGPTLPSPRQSPEDFARQSESVPLGHGPDLAEICATVRYLYSARSVTGQMIALDGGQHLAWRTADADIMVE